MATRGARRAKEDRVRLYKLSEYRDILRGLADRLRILRAQLSWTQERAAEECEISLDHYRLLEQERRNFTAVTLARLCRGFGLGPGAFFPGRDEQGFLPRRRATLASRPREKRRSRPQSERGASRIGRA